MDPVNDKMNLSLNELNNWLTVDETMSVTHTLSTKDIIEATVNHGKMNIAEEEESVILLQ